MEKVIKEILDPFAPANRVIEKPDGVPYMTVEEWTSVIASWVRHVNVTEDLLVTKSCFGLGGSPHLRTPDTRLCNTF